MMSPPSKDFAKQPLCELTRAPCTSLPWRARGIGRWSLEDYRIGSNIVEASNRTWQIDHLKYGPTGHINPIEDIEIISL
jgi:hypothetical protein